MTARQTMNDSKVVMMTERTAQTGFTEGDHETRAFVNHTPLGPPVNLPPQPTIERGFSF